MTPDAIHEHERQATKQAVHAWVAHFYETEQDWDEPTDPLKDAVRSVLTKSQEVESDLITELQSVHIALGNAEIEIGRLKRQRVWLWAGIVFLIVVCAGFAYALWGRI